MLPAFRPVPRTGVIFVTTEAARRGFVSGDPEWCNLGQGQPETGPLPGAPPRLTVIESVGPDDDYAPIGGLPELREAIAEHYNHWYRKGRASRYTAENVAVSGGGRMALTRVAAALGHINLGHFLPDYTAYEELLDLFRLFTPIPILRHPEQAYEFSASELRSEALGLGLGAVLLSNPCNPTGKHVRGAQLAEWVATAKDCECFLLLDEFYSHYVYGAELAGGMESAARYVEDVNRDPVVILDGFTKNWRYPGWRVTWTVAPKPVIEAVISAGSFLDGGGARPLQRQAARLFGPEVVAAETAAIQAAFTQKRRLMVDGLRAAGVRVDVEPEGTFYVWGSLAELPELLSTGDRFFEAALEHKVIVVPGKFFDVNPGKRRMQRSSRFQQHARFSFGPERAVLEEGLRRIAALVADARRSG